MRQLELETEKTASLDAQRRALKAKERDLDSRRADVTAALQAAGLPVDLTKCDAAVQRELAAHETALRAAAPRLDDASRRQALAEGARERAAAAVRAADEELRAAGAELGGAPADLPSAIQAAEAAIADRWKAEMAGTASSSPRMIN